MTLKQVVLFAFIGSITLTLLILACTLKFTEESDKEFTNNNWTLFGTGFDFIAKANFKKSLFASPI